MKTERKKRDKKHLKGRILRSISLILICSMILSTLIGYLYFNQVVRKQRLEEEKNRLMQVGSQIAFQAEDNRRFAQSILVDEQLQYLLEENVKENWKNTLQRRNGSIPIPIMTVTPEMIQEKFVMRSQCMTNAVTVI